ncbi:MAG: ATP-binding protein [Muribaculaceae bacterium]|nr:ATP-binding protein [Muribaculaceae bacterium]
MAINKEIVEKEIIKRLKLDNPWWVTREVPEDFSSMTPRPYINDFYEELRNVNLRRAPILMGPRRVGKTVMLYHSISRLIKDGIDPGKIIFVSLDTPIYNGIGLEKLMEYGVKAVEENNEVDLGNVEGYYVFFDEVQYLKDWERHLKSLVDTFRKIKFVASGSAAAALKMKSNESGAGRFTDFMLPPLTFSEFIELQGLDNIFFKSGEVPWGEYDTTDISTVNRHFLEYINFGGYPEVVFSSDVRKRADKYVKNDIVEKVLMRDLPSLYGISDTQELNSFFAHIAFRSGNEFSYQNLATDSGIRKDTIKKYLDYLEAAFLVKVLKRIDQNAKRLERMTTFKIYLTNPLLRSALFSPIEENDDAFGEIVETAIVAQWLQGHEADFYYANWHRGREKGEVDLVWTNRATQKACFATEIKWTDRYFENTAELKSLKGFLENNPDLKKAIVTTKTVWGEKEIAGRKVIFVPASIYAFGVSKMIHKKRESKLYS